MYPNASWPQIRDDLEGVSGELRPGTLQSLRGASNAIYRALGELAAAPVSLNHRKEK